MAVQARYSLVRDRYHRKDPRQIPAGRCSDGNLAAHLATVHQIRHTVFVGAILRWLFLTLDPSGSVDQEEWMAYVFPPCASNVVNEVCTGAEMALYTHCQCDEILMKFLLMLKSPNIVLEDDVYPVVPQTPTYIECYIPIEVSRLEPSDPRWEWTPREVLIEILRKLSPIAVNIEQARYAIKDVCVSLFPLNLALHG